MAEISDFDVTDANNTGRWPENMQFRNVNNAGRADEGLLARWYKDTNATIAASGSSNAYAITANRTLSAYAAGQLFGFIANHTNTAAATLNVSGLGAITIVRPDGSSLLAGDITNGCLVLVGYVAASAKFQLLTMPAVSAAISIPVGMIMAWPASAVPTGWLEAYGQNVSRTTYAALFAVYGTTYGAGDGSTTFGLPDCRGRVIAGEDDMGGSSADRLTDLDDGVDGDTLGAAGGLESTTLVLANLPSEDLTAASNGAHTHDVGFFQAATYGSGGGSAQTSNSAAGTSTGVDAALSDGAHTHTVPLGGSDTPINNVQPTIVFKWCILAVPAAALSTSGIGRNEQWVGARHMTSRATAGAGSATRDSGTSDITQPVFDFDDSSDEFAQFEWVPPKRWDRGTVTAIAYWTTDTGLAAETLRLTVQGVAISNDDPMNATFGTAATITDTFILQGDLHISPESGAVTIGGTPALADLVMFQIARDVSEDDHTGDARLLGIKLCWTSNATSDD